MKSAITGYACPTCKQAEVAELRPSPDIKALCHERGKPCARILELRCHKCTQVSGKPTDWAVEKKHG